MLKKITTFLLSAILLLSVLCSPLGVSAATVSTFSLDSFAYSPENKSYTHQNVFASGETLYVAVSVDRIENLGGITFEVKYDKNTLKFIKGNSFVSIADKDAVFNTNEISNAVRVIWETVSENETTLAGNIFYIAFEVLDDITAAQTTVQLSVIDLFENSDEQKDIDYIIAGNAVININSAVFPDGFIEMLDSLKDIVYGGNGDSLANIKKAEEIYAGLTTSQQKALKKSYPKQLEYLQTARTRYYKLAQNYADKLIENEVKEFLNKYKKVFSLTEKTVKLSDESAILSAQSAMVLLSNQASQKLTTAQKEHLPKLLERIEELKVIAEEKAEAKDYRDAYGEYFDEGLFATLKQQYEELATTMGEAIAIYNTLSDNAKSEVKDMYDFFLKVQVEIQKLIAENEKEQAIIKEVLEFQSRYTYVYSLNSINVSLADESALKMVIEAWEMLDEGEVKERLKTKIDSFKSLLLIIDGMKQSEEDTPPENDEPIILPPTDNVQTPSTDNQETVITQTNTIEKLINTLVGTESGFSTQLYIMLILLTLSVGCLVFTHYLSNRKIIAETEETEDEE